MNRPCRLYPFHIIHTLPYTQQIDNLIQIQRRDLKLTSGKKFTLVGTPIGQELKDLSEDDLPDVMNDLDVDISADPALQEAFINDRRNVRKIKEAVEKLDIQIMNAPREGKKLLVLDLDYSRFLFSKWRW